jgi:hypothetical protein
MSERLKPLLIEIVRLWFSAERPHMRSAI